MGGSVSAWFHTSPLWRRLLSGGPCASMRALQMLLAAGWTQQAVHGMGWSVRACFICGSGCSWLAAISMPGCAHPQMLPAARQTGHAAHGMGGSVSRWSLGGCHMTARPWALSAAMAVRTARARSQWGGRECWCSCHLWQWLLRLRRFLQPWQTAQAP